jgi:hypothetical protein
LWGRSWRIADFHDSIAVGQDGSTAVEENITAVFIGAFQGIHRTIPIQYPGPEGSNYSLFLTVRAVTGDAGQPLKYQRRRNGAYETLTIYIPGAVDTTRTIRIFYTVSNAVRFFPDHDEFYWNVTGNDWPVPIDHASATVAFPPDAAGSLRAQAFTGIYGSREQEVSSDVQGSAAVFETTNPLPMRGGLTVDVYLPKGILQEPGVFTRVLWFLRSNAILFLPVFALGVMFTLWWFKGRDPKPGMSIAPMYEPPAGMSPGEVGALMDDSVTPRDITSTVVDLAVRGFLKIQESDDRHLLWSNKDYIFHLLKPAAEWTGLPPQQAKSGLAGDPGLRPHERVMLEHMFDGGQTVRMSDLKNRFYVAVPVIKHDLLAALKLKGMYTLDPESAGAYVVGAAVLIGVPFLLLQFGGILDLFASVPMAVLAVVLSAAIILLFGRQMTAKSLLGVRTRVKILGFEEFMTRVDAERLKTLPPDTFEKYLPYAMALGVEHRWAQAFKDLLRQPPSWYDGPVSPGMLWTPILFTNSMHTMSTDLHTVMTMAPRSVSTGSGFSGGGFSNGGGFSGGGFGGGGGDAF